MKKAKNFQREVVYQFTFTGKSSNLQSSIFFGKMKKQVKLKATAPLKLL